MEDNKETNSATGDRQSDFAGTNPDRYGPPAAADDQDNPVNAQEAQNVTDGADRLSGEEADKARSKAMEGINQGKSE